MYIYAYVCIYLYNINNSTSTYYNNYPNLSLAILDKASNINYSNSLRDQETTNIKVKVFVVSWSINELL